MRIKLNGTVLMKRIFLSFFLILPLILLAQTKAAGIVVDQEGEPVAFANVVLKGTTQGTITNEDGLFYLESEETHRALLISFIGYQTEEILLNKAVNYDLNVVLVQGEQLDEVVVYVGKQSKKNNPAIDILKKIWAKKRINGLRQFKQYQYDKYEKVEFDLNSIDSAMMKSKLFKGMEFVFQDLDTSRISGKTYLPIFLNETFSKVYGDNVINQNKEDVLGNKNSGFSNNQAIIGFVKDLYNEYDVYDNYLKFFDKSFPSPLGKPGIDAYNYVLSDSAFIEDKWCYHIIYYPRRKNELTFKGDFWVNDTTYAVKKISLEVTKSANINWVKEIYIEQEFEVLNDSVFLLERDYMLSDFSLFKKEESKGVYGKRTTVYGNYQFDRERPSSFYKNKTDPFNPVTFERDSVFWKNSRLESLNKDEQGIYALLDTLKTVPRFKTAYNVVSILASGYVEIDRWNIDLGNIYSGIGFNDAEGIRLRGGARTYFGQNDPWRIEGYMAYGFKDKKFKHGISGKWLLDKKNRIIVSGGNRRDIEQLGINLTQTTDVLGRSVASSAIFTVGSNDRLTNINLTTFNLDLEPVTNFRIRFGSSFRTLSSALPDAFSLDYIDLEAPGGISSETKQFELNTILLFTPGKTTIGNGVERRNVNEDYSTFLLNYTKGLKGFLNSDFEFEKIQFSYAQPWQLGGFGRLLSTVEIGKTFGVVPLSLLSVIPGNQTYFTIYNTFSNLDFYEFVTDTYATVHLEQNFNGRLFSRIPYIRDLNLREIVGFRAAWGELSNANKLISSPTNIPLRAPSDEPYWEYSFGIGNIFKIFRIDFNFRGNYLDIPGANSFSVKGTFAFSF